MTKNNINYNRCIAGLAVGQTATLPRNAKASVVRATAYRLARDLKRKFSVSARIGQDITVTRVK